MFRWLFLVSALFAFLMGNYLWAQRGGGGRSSAPSASHTSVADPLAPSGAPPLSLLSPTHHAEEEPRVEFKSQTVLVQTPVVVTDKSGAHVRNLTKADFQILENGKEQKLGTFEEITATTSPFPPYAPKPNEFTNLFVDPGQRRMVTIVAIDTINTPYLDQVYGRKELIKYLSQHLETGQIFGLVMIGSRGMKVLHPLTSDSSQLIGVLKKLSGELPAMQEIGIDAQVIAQNQNALSNPSGLMTPIQLGDDDIESELRNFVLYGDAAVSGFAQDRAIEMTMTAFLNIAWSVSAIPGRKAILWATGGFPFIMDSSSAVPGGNLSLLYERAMKALNEAEISVYPVDVRGLVNYLPVADAKFSGPKSGQAMTQAILGRSWLHASTLDSLRDFAAMTGGRAYYNNNDLASGFQRAAEDSSSYYVLGYYLDTHNDKAGWRQLKVKVNKPGVEVRARNGFFVTNATMNPDAARKFDEDSAVNSPFDSTSIPITLHWLGMASEGGKKKVEFALNLPPTGVFINEADKNHFDIDFIAQANKDGVPVDGAKQVAKGDLTAEALIKTKAQGVFYKSALELPPGKYDVRVVVRDNLTGRVGSLSVPLTVN